MTYFDLLISVSWKKVRFRLKTFFYWACLKCENRFQKNHFFPKEYQNETVLLVQKLMLSKIHEVLHSGSWKLKFLSFLSLVLKQSWVSDRVINKWHAIKIDTKKFQHENQYQTHLFLAKHLHSFHEKTFLISFIFLCVKWVIYKWSLMRTYIR